MSKVDKIPLDKLTEGEDGSYAYLDKNKKPILIVSKDEYANAERINQIINSLRELEDRVNLLENK